MRPSPCTSPSPPKSVVAGASLPTVRIIGRGQTQRPRSMAKRAGFNPLHAWPASGAPAPPWLASSSSRCCCRRSVREREIRGRRRSNDLGLARAAILFRSRAMPTVRFDRTIHKKSRLRAGHRRHMGCFHGRTVAQVASADQKSLFYFTCSCYATGLTLGSRGYFGQFFVAVFCIFWQCI